MQKDSIKREQSQAGLSFAERKNRRSLAGGESNFRPQVKNKLLLLLALLLTAATGAWAQTNTVTWDNTNVFVAANQDAAVNKWDNASFTYGGVTIALSATEPTQLNLYGPNGASLTVYGADGDSFIFTAPEGKEFSRIEITNADKHYTFTAYGDWTGDELNNKAVWSGTPSSTVTLGGSNLTTFDNLQSIVFTFATPKYTVKMAENTVDAANWTISPTEAAEGETVTLQYNGRLKVKGVKATSDAAPAAPAGNPAPTTAAIDAYTGGAFAWDGDGSAATVDVTINTFAANDKISIFSANNDNVQFTTTAGGATASFTGTATDGDPTYFALYPYTAGLTLDGTTIQNVVIPETQNVSTTAWDKSAAIAYATTSGSSLTFHNACALLKITNDSGDDTWITITAFNPGVLTGTFNLDTSTGALTIQSDIKRVRAKNVPNNTTIYLAIAPCTLSSGFRANWSNPMTGNDGNKDKMGSVTFEAGKIYDLGKTSDWHH